MLKNEANNKQKETGLVPPTPGRLMQDKEDLVFQGDRFQLLATYKLRVMKNK